jgi:hypothetical protein
MTEDKVLEVLAAMFAGDEPTPEQLADGFLEERLDEVAERFGLSDEDCEIIADALNKRDPKNAN